MKDLLLIDPPFRNYFKKEIAFDDFKRKYDIPYGLLSIASLLEKNDFGVSIFPLDYYLAISGTCSVKKKHIEICVRTKKEFLKAQEKLIKKEIIKQNPKAIGVTAYTMQYPNALRILKIIKEVNPRIITIFGGPHAMFMDKEALDTGLVDIVVRGEGDWTILELMKRIRQNQSYGDIKGISYKKGNRIIRNLERPLGNMEELPVPNYELLPFDYVKNSNVELVNSRGCYYNCNFCISVSQYHQTVRPKKISNIISEIKTLRDKYGIKELGLLDETVNANPKYFQELCKVLTKFDDMSFFAQTRANFVNDKDIELMKKSNIKSLVIGAESASPKVLKAMNKKISWQLVKAACHKISKHKLATGTFWIIGHPGSSPKEEEKTLAAINYLLKNKLSGYIEAGVFVPYPGTAVFNHPRKFGIEILDWNFEKWGRLKSKPIYRLKSFSQKDIYSYWKKAVRLIESYGQKNVANIPIEPECMN